jgi:DNA processing protein
MLLKNAFSPVEELRAYETICALPDQTLESVAAQFKDEPRLPSEVLKNWRATSLFSQVQELFEAVGQFLASLTSRFSVSLHRDFQYPRRLRSADLPPEMLYYRGDIRLAGCRSISIVGTRTCSDASRKRAERLGRELAEHFLIVSGLARGIDTAAMTGAVEAGGRVIGVIGTPITESYPPENRGFQEEVADKNLLISHVPCYRSSQEGINLRARQYFPWRNQTMAALSEGTVIVEAGETSGTLIQARSALKQGRKLFILNSCFDTNRRWPKIYEEQGAIRVRSVDDILAVLEKPTNGGEALDSD